MLHILVLRATSPPPPQNSVNIAAILLLQCEEDGSAVYILLIQVWFITEGLKFAKLLFHSVQIRTNRLKGN